MFNVQARTIARVVYTDPTGRQCSAEPGVSITLDAVQANDLELIGALIVEKDLSEVPVAPEADQPSKKSR